MLGEGMKEERFALFIDYEYSVVHDAKENLAPMISRDHFFLAVFVRVTHDGLSERGTTRSLLYLKREVPFTR